MSSFHWHTVTMLIDSQKAEIEKTQKRLKGFNMSPRIIKRNLFYTWDAVSLLVNKKPLKELFIEARKGDDESLFKLIKVDKTLLGFDWVQARINKAIYSGDYNFFESLGKAIQTDPLKNRKKQNHIFLCS